MVRYVDTQEYKVLQKYGFYPADFCDLTIGDYVCWVDEIKGWLHPDRRDSDPFVIGEVTKMEIQAAEEGNRIAHFNVRRDTDVEIRNHYGLGYECHIFDANSLGYGVAQDLVLEGHEVYIMETLIAALRKEMKPLIARPYYNSSVPIPSREGDTD